MLHPGNEALLPDAFLSRTNISSALVVSGVPIAATILTPRLPTFGSAVIRGGRLEFRTARAPLFLFIGARRFHRPSIIEQMFSRCKGGQDRASETIDAAAVTGVGLEPAESSAMTLEGSPLTRVTSSGETNDSPLRSRTIAARPRSKAGRGGET